MCYSYFLVDLVSRPQSFSTIVWKLPVLIFTSLLQHNGGENIFTNHLDRELTVADDVSVLCRTPYEGFLLTTRA